jgi:hypothetical protein
MALVLFHNHGSTAIYIGGRAVPPGEAREVDAALVPVESEPPGDGVPSAVASPKDGAGLFAPARRPRKKVS